MSSRSSVGPNSSHSPINTSQTREFTAIPHAEWTQMLGFGPLSTPTQMVCDAYESYRSRPIPGEAEDPFRPPSLQPGSCQGIPRYKRPILSDTGKNEFLDGTVDTLDVYPVVTLDDGTKARNHNYHGMRVIAGSMYAPQSWYKTAKTVPFVAIDPAAGVPRYPGDRLLIFDVPCGNKVKTDRATASRNSESNSAATVGTDRYFPLEDTCEEIYKAFSKAYTDRVSRAKEKATSAKTGGSIRLPE